MKPLKFIISGGGTGGHIYPAIAIADCLKERHPQAEFLFVGAKDRMEMQKVPQAGYAIKGLWISGIERKLSLKNLLFPLKLIYSLWKSQKIIKEFKPSVAIGTGGFASGPLLKAAVQNHIPTLLQEQNSFAGITNKWLAQKASKICVAYAHMDRFFPKDKIKLTGNPVRQDLLNIKAQREKALAHFRVNPRQKTLLVLGGSLGAQKINEHIAENIDFFKTQNINLIWQCGKLYHQRFKHFSEQPDVQVHPFLDHMNLAYAAADIIISRAGAISVSELCLVGKPVIFIPSPNVAEDHQTKNANALAQNQAALLIKEQDLGKRFEQTFKALLHSKEKRKELSKNIKKMAKPQATPQITDEVEKLAGIKQHA